MYPLVRYRLIRKAIQHYSLTFNKEDREVIEADLKMLKFSMRNTLVIFRERYYGCGVEDDPVMRALAIG